MQGFFFGLHNSLAQNSWGEGQGSIGGEGATPSPPRGPEERIALFQEWVLPLFIYAARAYFPTDYVIAKVTNVYRVTLRLTSWGLTLPILAMPPSAGGNHLPHPRAFLLWQHATAFFKYLHEPQAAPSLSGLHLRAWAKAHGVSLDPRFLPWLQLGPIAWKKYPFLGMSCKAFSLLGKPAPVPPPKHEVMSQLPAWHTTLCRDRHLNTHYSPSLIGRGVLSFSNLQETMDEGATLPRTWAPVYAQGISQVQQPALRPEGKAP